jgi:isopentenyl-diphosphate delta-isomerase
MSSEQNKLSNEDPTSKARKSDHIEMAFESQVTQQLIDPRFYYEPLLSGHPENVKRETQEFLSKPFAYPIWVSSMTGGTAFAGIINKNLARACGEFGFGMGLGSCRALLHSDDTFDDFNVRSRIGDEALYANLGIAQLEELISAGQLNKVGELVKKLQADGLIVHVNPLQEWLQPEGDHISRPPIDIIKQLIDDLDIKLIVKEVGQGMGYKSLEALFKLPIEAIDFAANGGTNFAKLEMHRASDAVKENYRKVANLGHSAEEMVNLSNRIIEELGDRCLCKQVIVSGGVKDFLDGYYYTQKLNIPAIYGQASAFLKYAREDYDQLRNYVDAQVSGYRLAEAFLTIKES